MPIVNYIREHDWFIEFAADEGLTPNDIALYDALMHIINRKADGKNWPDDFIRIRNDRLLPICRMGFDAMARSRNKLKQKGVIDFLNGERNKEAPAYKILYKFSVIDCYPFTADNNTDNTADKNNDNSEYKTADKQSGKPADIIPNLNDNNIHNQNRDYSHTDHPSSSDGGRGRLNEYYIDSAGLKQKCRFDSAFLNSDRARMAVAGRILNQFDGEMDSENAHYRLCEFLHDGMPPEILEDEICEYRSLRKYIAAMGRIFTSRHFEEKRDELEMKRCMEAAGGNERMAQYLYRHSGRNVPDGREADG